MTATILETKVRQKLAITLALLHQWQSRTLEWQEVQNIGKLTDAEMLALDPVEREDDEPALIRKVLAAITGGEVESVAVLQFRR